MGEFSGLMETKTLILFPVCLGDWTIQDKYARPKRKSATKNKERLTDRIHSVVGAKARVAMRRTCEPSPQVIQAGGSGSSSHPWLQSELKDVLDCEGHRLKTKDRHRRKKEVKKERPKNNTLTGYFKGGKGTTRACLFTRENMKVALWGSTGPR